MQTATGDVGARGLQNARGRKDQGQEAVIKLESVNTRIDDLVELYKKAEEAAQVFKDAIKKTAEESGLLAASVSTFIKARASDEEAFEQKKTKVMQMALIFENCDSD